VDVSKAPTINTGLFDQNSAGRGVQKAIQGKTPYNGDDLVADGIHQVKSEPPYNGDDLVADGIHMSKSKQLVPLAEKPISKFRDSDFVKALVDPTQFARV
jgi:hypothetical protein